jgi:hypothetical protein
MLKSTYLGGIIVGLAILLAACGGLPAGEAQVPAEAEMPASVESAETEAMSVKAEEHPAEEVVVPEEVADNAATDEMVNQNEKAGPAEIDADAEVAATEKEVAAEEMEEVEVATETESMLAEETVSVEEAEMPEEAADHEQTTTSAEVAADEQEMMSEEAVEAVQGPTAEQLQLLESLTVFGAPSELNNEVWLNSEPLKLAELQGKVAIVEFWTYG